jgi:lipopolysaccharide biosynthesis regulator YciM
LAQDFNQAGLFDRAEEAYKALDGTAFDTDARLALLGLYERSRDWRSAVDVASKLERSGIGSFASRIAHYWCEVAIEADAHLNPADGDDAMRRARAAAPQATRVLALTGERHAKQGHHAEALVSWGELLASHSASFNLVATGYAKSAIASGKPAPALDQLKAALARSPTLDLMNAVALLEPDLAEQQRRLTTQLEVHPTLSIAERVIGAHATETGVMLSSQEASGIRKAMVQAAKPLQRYRCAACGFEAQHYFWQCPGCQGWDTYPPVRLEDL